MKQTMYTKKEVLTGVLVIALVLLLAAGLFCGQSALLFAITLIASITFGIYFLVELFLPETRAYPYRKQIISAVPAIAYLIMFFTSGVADSYLTDSQDELGNVYAFGDYYTVVQDYASTLDGYAAFASLCAIAAFAVLLADVGMYFSIRDKLRSANAPKEAPKDDVELVTDEQLAEPTAPAEEPATEAPKTEEAPAEAPADEVEVTDVD